MSFLIQQTLIYAVPLMIVALAGVFAERSGIINLALEGIMIFGAFIGVLFVRQMQGLEVFTAAKAAGDWGPLQGLVLLAKLVSAAMGALFSLLLSFASSNLRADQTIGGTALNLLAPALVLFFIRIIANQNTLQMLTGDAASWFMIKKSTLGIDKNTDLGLFGETFVNKVYLATYVCILLFIILSILLYKTRFGLRLFLPKEMARVSYFGMGPMESYCDKHHAASHDYFSSTIWQQHEDYIRPQENGSHYDCDYVQLDGAGIKLTAVGAKPFCFNASHYTQEELTEKAHNYELHPCDSTVLCLDCAQNGIGSASCGPRLAEQYRLDDASFDFSIRLIPEKA